MNLELTSPVIFDNLKKIFPELETIPHADTLARLLKQSFRNKANIQLIKDLMKKKKFKKLLIDGRLPITIDGTQKLFRDGLLNDGRWCERSVEKVMISNNIFILLKRISHLKMASRYL